MRVRDLMTTDVMTLGADDPMVTARELMGFRRVRHLPVLEDGKLVGLVTHRDLLRGALSPFADNNRVDRMVHDATLTAREIMHTEVSTCSPDDELAAAAERMASSRYGCLPVVEEGRLVGIVTEADFMRLTAVLLRHLAATEPTYVDTVRDLMLPAELGAPAPPPWRKG
ncbi:MAG: CBS domain-containing membrane protein [Myxococcota bacterium]|jgi:CBS domain-containing membrane protein